MLTSQEDRSGTWRWSSLWGDGAPQKVCSCPNPWSLWTGLVWKWLCRRDGAGPRSGGRCPDGEGSLDQTQGRRPRDDGGTDWGEVSAGWGTPQVSGHHQVLEEARRTHESPQRERSPARLDPSLWNWGEDICVRSHRPCSDVPGQPKASAQSYLPADPGFQSRRSPCSPKMSRFLSL